MKKKISTGKTEIKFSTVSDIKKYLNDNRKVKTSQQSSHRKNDKRFFGTESYEEFENTILKNGNPKLLKEIKRKVNKRVDELEHRMTEKSMYNFDVVGDFFDVGCYMSGEPEHWLKEIKIKDEKFICVKINGWYNANVRSETIVENASQIIALLRVLEGRGFLTQIDLCFNGRDMTIRGREDILIEIPIKDYNQPLDYKKLSILLDVGFFRRGIFRVLELTYPLNLSGGYGRYSQKDGYINLANYDEVSSLEKTLLEKDK